MLFSSLSAGALEGIDGLFVQPEKKHTWQVLFRPFFEDPIEEFGPSVQGIGSWVSRQRAALLRDRRGLCSIFFCQSNHNEDHLFTYMS